MRNVVEYVHYDFGDTFLIFVYGGFMGLMMSTILRVKEKDERTTAKCNIYTGDMGSVTFSLLGACFLFAFFPGILLDQKPNSVETLGAPHTLVNGPISIWYAMTASVVTGVATNALITDKVDPR